MSSPSGPPAPIPSDRGPEQGSPQAGHGPPAVAGPPPKPPRVTEGPAIGLPPGVSIGEVPPRLLAWLVEASVPLVLFWIITPLVWSNSEGVAAPVVITVLSLLVTVGWVFFLGSRYTVQAAGPGTKLADLQLVGMADGRPLDWGRWVLRYVIFTVAVGLPVVNVVFWLSMWFHPRRQGWHDLVADAVIIKARAVAPPRPKPPKASALAPTAERAAGVPGENEPTVGLTSGTAASAGTAASFGSANPVSTYGGYASPSSAHYGPVRRSASSAASASAPAPVAPEPFVPDPAAPVPESRPTDPDPTSPFRRPTHGRPDPASVAPPPAPAGYAESAQTASDPAPGVRAWSVRVDDRPVTVTSLVLLGRNPQREAGEEDAELIKVRDEARTVSKTHLALGVDHRGLFVTDRRSTNGSAVTSPDGAYRLLTAGERTYVEAGWTVAFGQHGVAVDGPANGS